MPCNFQLTRKTKLSGVSSVATRRQVADTKTCAADWPRSAAFPLRSPGEIYIRERGDRSAVEIHATSCK